MCLNGTVCFNLGSCVNNTCVCSEGLLPESYCVDSIVEVVPDEFLAHMVISGLVYSLVALLALVFLLRARAAEGSFSRSQLALAFTCASSALAALSETIDPFLFRAAKQQAVTFAYRFPFTLIANLALAFLAAAYAIILASWVNIRSVSRGKQAGAHGGWSKPAWITFLVVLVLVFVLAILLSALRAFGVFLLGTTVYFIFLVALCLFIGGYIITTGVLTLRMIKQGRGAAGDGRDERTRRVATQIVALGCCLAAAIVALAILSLVEFESPSGFVWGRNFFPFLVQTSLYVPLLAYLGGNSTGSSSSSGNARGSSGNTHSTIDQATASEGEGDVDGEVMVEL